MVTLSIIQEAQKKDTLAQRKVFELYGRMLFRLAKRYLVDQAKSEDAVSESFYIIFKKMDGCHFIAVPPFEMWMKQIVVHECLRILRKEKRFEVLTEQNHDSCSIDDATVECLTAAEIFRVIEGLPAGYRTVFNLHEIEGYSHTEIAELLEISPGTSKSQLSKAKNILQQKIIDLDPAYAKRKIV
ncbi:sigma-70 family RNA polymerase sigma factor [Dyadobacter chenwenxiniae]|uniref:Sigma-70 family RNA polymerase sigma factor n=1 Tax=Dyadobacter chenwenxiniae TaxID=2906456 RepID=A0A9X1TGG0_9BACT|nr:sigma-70 family RNA polymerase sigma factor [Dyadobacter chenwenxiniae]MCF0064092.1 sigma-70 family RNA polymerase sigma factor [Dyadobacter chenwenxiniae]UON82820.1 sigma-70 family RNA polymerase sigma factor [Dyadobacter chenwenxiniae]